LTGFFQPMRASVRSTTDFASAGRSRAANGRLDARSDGWLRHAMWAASKRNEAEKASKEGDLRRCQPRLARSHSTSGSERVTAFHEREFCGLPWIRSRECGGGRGHPRLVGRGG
jgi:hypothetical protein